MNKHKKEIRLQAEILKEAQSYQKQLKQIKATTIELLTQWENLIEKLQGKA